ncbi:hypothetical protein PHYPSEUDO_003558 [Phytophthora pseudosyringae]|uniref:Uncharacterized protein n=1 Tax=Phytophthora pseudosyringae TaxID=221518 RepID=A0A8T1VU72_9STRA|nr:hypothetical protein PHYPSEUDO_003558 [Phytophthora pseudosyringae]
MRSVGLLAAHFGAYPFGRRYCIASAQMESFSSNGPSAHQQLRSFMSLPADDEMAQLILEELSFSRRSFMGVAAEIANSPSSALASGLNAISEGDEEE